jgi:DNA-binding transcriptional LysR family regulator
MDKLEAIEIFVTVAQENGFAAAARKLAKSPAAVTRAISALEGELACKLFRRTTRTVHLTESGAAFLVDAKRIVSDVEESVTRRQGHDSAITGTLVVTASTMFGASYVSPIVLQFLAQQPALHIHAVLVDRLVDLHQEGVDVAVRIAALRDSSLRAIKVGQVTRIVCASPDYLTRNGRPTKPTDLTSHRTIMFALSVAPAQWTFSKRASVSKRKSQRVTLQPQLTTNSSQFTLAAGIAGRGIIRALSYQVADDLTAGRLVRILPAYEPPPLPIHVIHTGGRRPSVRVRAFVDFLVHNLRDDRRLQG